MQFVGNRQNCIPVPFAENLSAESVWITGKACASAVLAGEEAPRESPEVLGFINKRAKKGSGQVGYKQAGLKREKIL